MSADLTDPPKRWPGQWQWAAVCAANLIVPLPLGLLCAWDGWLGVLLGVTLLWVLGALAVAASPLYGKVLTTGGVAVALSQLAPLAQFNSGLYAMHVARKLGFAVRDGPMAPAEAVVVTVITGWLLMLAVAVGAAVVLARHLLRQRDPAGEE